MHGKVPMVEGRCTQNFRFQLLVFFTLYATLAFCNTQLLVFPRYQWRAKRLSKHHLQANQNTSFVWEKSFSVLKQLKKDSTMFWSNFFQKDSTMFWSNLKKSNVLLHQIETGIFSSVKYLCMTKKWKHKISTAMWKSKKCGDNTDDVITSWVTASSI